MANCCQCCPCCKKPEDEEFETYMRVILSLMTTLRRPEDKECVQEILRHCTKLHNSGRPAIRRYNKAFLAYFLKVLFTTSSTQPLEIYEEWYKTHHTPSPSKGPGTGSHQDQPQTIQVPPRLTTRVWLEENKSYFAMDKTPDGAVIFYSAVAVDPKAGWDKGGIKKALEQYDDTYVETNTTNNTK